MLNVGIMFHATHNDRLVDAATDDFGESIKGVDLNHPDWPSCGQGENRR